MPETTVPLTDQNTAMSYSQSADERRMSRIAESMLDILELAGGRYRSINNFTVKKSSLLPAFHRIGVNASMVSDTSKSENAKFIDWERLLSYHPDSLTDLEFTEQYLVQELTTLNCFSENALIELTRAAGWYLEQEDAIAEDLEKDIRRRVEGWRTRLNRSYWWVSALAFVLLFLATTYDPTGKSSWELNGLQLGLAGLGFLIPAILWALIALRAVRFHASSLMGNFGEDGDSKKIDQAIALLRNKRRNVLAMQRTSNLTAEVIKLLPFLKQQRRLYFVAQIVSCVWLAFLIALLIW